jgi:hypothetical protein
VTDIVIRSRESSLDAFSLTVSRVSDGTGDYLSIFAFETDAQSGKVKGVAHGFIETEDAAPLLDLLTDPIEITEPAYLADAPEITDDDRDAEDEYASQMPDWTPEPFEDDTYTFKTVQEQLIGADQLGFERGYDAAVRDLRNGLMHDEFTPVAR